jgi:hypothetical protein
MVLFSRPKLAVILLQFEVVDIMYWLKTLVWKFWDNICLKLNLLASYNALSY